MCYNVIHLALIFFCRPLSGLLSWLIPTAKIVKTEKNILFPEIQAFFDEGQLLLASLPVSVICAPFTNGGLPAMLVMSSSCKLWQIRLDIELHMKTELFKGYARLFEICLSMMSPMQPGENSACSHFM